MTEPGRLAVVVGDPIEHSLSPVIHRAAFAALGMPHRFERRRAGTPSEVAAVVGAMRTEGWLGMSVTMPAKPLVVEYLDVLTPTAARLGVVNCVFWDGDALTGDNTDGAGVVWALQSHLGTPLAGRCVVVLGAGGAARACVLAAAGEGAAEVVVVNRTESTARAAVALAPGVARVGTTADVERADVVLNATPAGMAGTGAADDLPCEEVPGPGRVAMDLVYHPPSTPWLRRAGAAGAVTENGVPMLVGQAAAAFERWCGVPAPTDAMFAAVADHLSSR